jgi:long-chain acyl-CoA synthetase
MTDATDAPLDGGNVGGIFIRWAGTGRVAFVDVTGGDIETPVAVGYDEFDDRCARVASGLLARGLRRGARIGIVADNSVDYAACYFGIARAGLVTVPMNIRQPADVLSWIAADSEMEFVFHDAANRDRVPAGVPSIAFESGDWSSLLDHEPAAVAVMEPDEVAVQMYTSGSTGRPKGVLLSHGGQLFNIKLYLDGVMPMDPDERLLVSAPMYHKNASMQLKMALRLGGSTVLLRRFDAEDYLRAIDLHGVTAMTGVPTMFALMFARSDLLDTLDRSTVRRLSIGSAPMTQALFDEARQLFPGCVVTNGYGTTEVVAVFGGHPLGVPRPDISVGHPLAEVETRLIDAETGTDAVPHPETGHRQGELWVRSDGMMLGYHGLADLTAARLTTGWYHTGDVMESDSDGWHFFVGRVDDMFSCAGENVYPGDVEQMLERCPSVHQAAVVPVADELKGALPVAFVVPVVGQTPTEEQVKQWSIENGPAYQHPRAVWFVDALPLAGTAKIDKSALASEAKLRWRR